MQKHCPSQRAYIAIEDGYISTSDIEDDIEDEEDQDADEEDGEVLGGEATTAYRSIIVQRVHNSQVQQPEKLQRHNLFQIFFVINNRRARVIIDGGSCNNLVSSNLVKKLGLITRPHPHPYHIQWLNDSRKAKEYGDIFLVEIPPGLPPMRGIEHQTNLISGATLPNRAAY